MGTLTGNPTRELVLLGPLMELDNRTRYGKVWKQDFRKPLS
jgi:hypothetical protein